MRYEQSLPIELAEAKANVASGDPSLIADALLRASLSDVDPRWVEDASLRSLARPEHQVKWAALTALAHVVRRYRRVDIAAVLAVVMPLRDDPALSGKVGDLLDDVDVFLVK